MLCPAGSQVEHRISTGGGGKCAAAAPGATCEIVASRSPRLEFTATLRPPHPKDLEPGAPGKLPMKCIDMAPPALAARLVLSAAARLEVLRVRGSEGSGEF